MVVVFGTIRSVFEDCEEFVRLASALVVGWISVMPATTLDQRKLVFVEYWFVKKPALVDGKGVVALVFTTSASAPISIDELAAVGPSAVSIWLFVSESLPSSSLEGGFELGRGFLTFLTDDGAGVYFNLLDFFVLAFTPPPVEVRCRDSSSIFAFNLAISFVKLSF